MSDQISLGHSLEGLGLEHFRAPDFLVASMHQTKTDLISKKVKKKKKKVMMCFQSRLEECKINMFG